MSEGLKKVIDDLEVSLNALPLAIAKVIREDVSLTREQKWEAVAMVREWVNYVEKYNVQSDNLYILRSHLESFADQIFPVERTESSESITRTPINTIRTHAGVPVAELLATVTNPEIVQDRRVLVYGGVARTILKALVEQRTGHATESLDPELPISDVDMMIVGDMDAEEIAARYGSDLTGTKIVQEPQKEIAGYFSTVDVTMNQAIIYDGNLYYTDTAFDDVSHGLIKAQGSEKSLFDRDSVLLPDGNVYLLRGAFYRTLAVLLRGRGTEIVVSQENIDAEKEKIGRYWLVLLFVKLLKMEEGSKRDEAILQWYQVAKDIGSTETDSPVAFLGELIQKFPGFSYGQKDNNFDTEAQTRWLIRKLVQRGEEKVMDSKPGTDGMPQTYTPANIKLRPYEGSRDLDEFWKVVHEYKEGGIKSSV